MSFLLILLLAHFTLEDTDMTETQASRALKLVISDTGSGQKSVQVLARSAKSQRVSYELKTSGNSTTTHKGATILRADQPSTLSSVAFSIGAEWCVTLEVQEELGGQYRVEEGNKCR